MKIDELIQKDYPVTGQYEGVSVISNTLYKYNFIAVTDESGRYVGILTPSDLIEHPHKIVADCITPKEKIFLSDSQSVIIEKFGKQDSVALPVFDDKENFLGVIHKKSVLNSAETKIKELYLKSIMSDKAKIEFMNNINHEIRTPLSGMLGFMDVVSSKGCNYSSGGDTENAIIRKSAEKFLFIMNELMELSLINAGEKIPIKRSSVSLEELFMDMFAFIDDLNFSQQYNITLNYRKPKVDVTLLTNPAKLKHIIYLLVENSIKFSGDKRVEFGYRLEDDDKKVTIFVNNTIDEQFETSNFQLSRDFCTNTVADNKQDPEISVELQVVKKIAALLGGTISFEMINREMSIQIHFQAEES